MRIFSRKKIRLLLIAITITVGGLFPCHLNALYPDSPPDYYLIVGSESSWSFFGTKDIIFCVGNNSESYHRVCIDCLNNDESIDVYLRPLEMITRHYHRQHAPWEFSILLCPNGEAIILAAWNT